MFLNGIAPHDNLYLISEIIVEFCFGSTEFEQSLKSFKPFRFELLVLVLRNHCEIKRI